MSPRRPHLEGRPQSLPRPERGTITTGATPQPSTRDRTGPASSGKRLSLAAAAGFSAVVVFQLALALGAPLGAAAYGGTTSGQLPADLRLASVFQAATWSGAALIVLSRGGVAAVPLPTSVSRWGTWVLVGVLTSGALLNAASSSGWERFGWAPLVAALAVVCLRLARTSTALRSLNDP